MVKWANLKFRWPVKKLNVKACRCASYGQGHLSRYRGLVYYCHASIALLGLLIWTTPGESFNISYVLLKDVMKSQTHVIGRFNDHMTLKFVMCLSSTAAESPVKFQSDQTIVNSNLMASRLARSCDNRPLSQYWNGPQFLYLIMLIMMFSSFHSHSLFAKTTPPHTCRSQNLPNSTWFLPLHRPL